MKDNPSFAAGAVNEPGSERFASFLTWGLHLDRARKLRTVVPSPIHPKLLHNAAEIAARGKVIASAFCRIVPPVRLKTFDGWV